MYIHHVVCNTASDSTNGSLRFISAMCTLYRPFRASYYGGYLRAPVKAGDGVILTIRIDMAIDGMMSFTPPEVIWLHNGRPFRVLPINSASMVRCEMFANPLRVLGTHLINNCMLCYYCNSSLVTRKVALVNTHLTSLNISLYSLH